MTTMRCEAVRDALPALASGALGEAEVAEVREHLASCDECADAWAVVGALAQDRIETPAGLADRVSAHVAARSRRGAGRGASPMRWLAGAGAAAAAVIALVIAMPEREPDEVDALHAAASTRTDPFLDPGLFGATTPAEAELDGMIRVAALDPASLPADIVAEQPFDDAADVPPLAMDVGAPLGDWPGADGMSAGDVMLNDLTYEEMELLLTEMES